MSGADFIIGGRARSNRIPTPSAVVELLKPITWFAPMWAYMCGVTSSGGALSGHWLAAIGGIVLAGPAVCATSQATNDWFDRHVDAINEPARPIPSGRIPGRWGLWMALAWTGLSLSLASALGHWVLLAATFGLLLSWVYSAPPLRLKAAGWWGPIAVALCYEGLSWFTGAAVMSGGLPGGPVIAIAGLYSLGAVGIMILNDFKAVVGDQALGIRSVPVDLGIENAAWMACIIMAAPQIVVATLLLSWGHPIHSAAVVGLLGLQCGLMARLLRDPAGLAPWYNGTGTTLYVLGMLVSSFALGRH